MSTEDEVMMQDTSSVIATQVVLNASGLAQPYWVMEQFREAGFQVGPLVGISFSIAAPVQKFEEFFQVRSEEKGYLPFASAELPLSALNPALRQHIQSVLFTKPPDFGPGGQY